MRNREREREREGESKKLRNERKVIAKIVININFSDTSEREALKY